MRECWPAGPAIAPDPANLGCGYVGVGMDGWLSMGNPMQGPSAGSGPAHVHLSGLVDL